MAGSVVEWATLDCRVMSSSPMGMALLKKKNQGRPPMQRLAKDIATFEK